jgi:hypothetical protein
MSSGALKSVKESCCLSWQIKHSPTARESLAVDVASPDELIIVAALPFVTIKSPPWRCTASAVAA